MLTCHFCMRRYLQTIIGESPVFPSAGGTTISHERLSFRRNYASSYQTPILKGSQGHDKPTFRLTHGYTSAPNQPSKEDQRRKWLESRGVRPHSKQFKGPRPLPEVVSKHLTYLKDPLKLADFVRRTLRDGDFETAIGLVRAASKDVQCTVSWNHLVDWQLSQGKMNAAIKTFNEVCIGYISGRSEL